MVYSVYTTQLASELTLIGGQLSREQLPQVFHKFFTSVSLVFLKYFTSVSKLFLSVSKLFGIKDYFNENIEDNITARITARTTSRTTSGTTLGTTLRTTLWISRPSFSHTPMNFVHKKYTFSQEISKYFKIINNFDLFFHFVQEKSS